MQNCDFWKKNQSFLFQSIIPSKKSLNFFDFKNFKFKLEISLEILILFSTQFHISTHHFILELKISFLNLKFQLQSLNFVFVMEISLLNWKTENGTSVSVLKSLRLTRNIFFILL